MCPPPVLLKIQFRYYLVSLEAHPCGYCLTALPCYCTAAHLYRVADETPVWLSRQIRSPSTHFDASRPATAMWSCGEIHGTRFGEPVQTTVHAPSSAKNSVRTKGTRRSLTKKTGGLPRRKGARIPPPNAMKNVRINDSAQNSSLPPVFSIFLTCPNTTVVHG